jgi:type 1 glutamine amidotransferase
MRWLAACLWLLMVTAASSAAGPVRVLLVTGGHAHQISFYEMFNSAADYDVTVNPHPQAFRPGMVKSYDVVVLYDLADVTDEAERANLRKFVEAGKGVVILHHALADNQTWPWWYEEVAGGRYVLKAAAGQPASKFKHDVEFKVRPVGKHPVLEGIEPFEILDEAYKDMWHSPRNQVLLETDNPLNDQPLAWVSSYSKSRVVYIQLGHDQAAHRNPAYRKLLRNAIRWTAAR